MMDHWRLAYLGMRHFPHELTEFELNTFFTFSARERALIDGRRSHLYRLAVGLHLGFVRMTGRTLDAYKQIPKRLWHHLGDQLGVEPPDLGTLRALYDDRTDTLADHQKLAYDALGFRPMAEHQRRYVVRWLKERLSGRQDSSTALYDLKRWLYDYDDILARDLPQVEVRTEAHVRDTTGTKPSIGFEELLHPIIFAHVFQHYVDGHYRDAVLNSVVAIFDLMRERTGLDLDGAALATQVLSLEKPHLILSELDTESGRNDQKGFMQILVGAYLGIRNPKAHSLNHDLDPEKAAQYLIFASLLARRIYEAKDAPKT